jgi:hypothetical protein
MTPSDPTPLFDDPQVSASLRGDLAHAKAASVQGLDHAAGVAGLQAAIAAEAGAATAAASGASTFSKVAIAILLVGGAAAAVWGATREHDVVEPQVATATSVGEAAPRARSIEPEPAPVEPTRIEPAKAPVVVANEPALAPEEEEEDASEDTESSKVSRPRATKVRKAVPEGDATDRVLREARLVADARDALGHDPNGALTLVQQAAREFPSGQLVEEREAIAIRALADLGRSEAARARAERFLARFGSGPHAEAVRRAIGE